MASVSLLSRLFAKDILYIVFLLHVHTSGNSWTLTTWRVCVEKFFGCKAEGMARRSRRRSGDAQAQSPQEGGRGRTRPGDSARGKARQTLPGRVGSFRGLPGDHPPSSHPSPLLSPCRAPQAERTLPAGSPASALASHRTGRRCADGRSESEPFWLPRAAGHTSRGGDTSRGAAREPLPCDTPALLTSDHGGLCGGSRPHGRVSRRPREVSHTPPASRASAAERDPAAADWQRSGNWGRLRPRRWRRPLPSG